jgi:hypothetical protein
LHGLIAVFDVDQIIRQSFSMFPKADFRKIRASSPRPWFRLWLRLLKKSRDGMVGATMESRGWPNGIFVTPLDVRANQYSRRSPMKIVFQQLQVVCV